MNQSIRNMKRYSRLLLSSLLLLTLSKARAADTFELRKGDHVCIIGNTLADRMQHSGWFEALLYARFPKHDLVFRNLGFSGDELNVRLRSEGFGTPDEWLKKEQADVIFAFFGYNESFKGIEGLAQFRKDLDLFVKDTLAKNYSGKGAPRLVLFSPIAAEKHPDPNFPNPAALNAKLQLYTFAMAEIAKANGIPFVDLFAPSQQLYSQAKEPLTINGVHLTDDGYRALAPALFQGLVGEAPSRATDVGSFGGTPPGDQRKERCLVFAVSHRRRLQCLRWPVLYEV